MGKIRRGWSKQIKSIENGEVKRRIKRKKDMSSYDIYEGLHPALVSEEDFMKAQEIRLDKKPLAKVKDEFKLMNPFSGLLFCATCGKTIGRTTMSAKQNKAPRLRCSNSRNCHNGSAYFDTVEKEIMEALRSWLKGYKVKIDTVGYAEDIEAAKLQLSKLAQEESKLQKQMDNAFDLVEQGIYSLEVFQTRRAKLTDSIEEIGMRKAKVQATLIKLEATQNTQINLIPQTEELLASYDDMTNEERNALLKEILEKIEYYKGADGKIVIDLYPRLPRI